MNFGAKLPHYYGVNMSGGHAFPAKGSQAAEPQEEKWRAAGVEFDTDLPSDFPSPSDPSARVELIDRPALTPVIVGAPDLWNWKGLRRAFSRGERFLMIEGVQPANRLLAQCQQTLPCILIVDEMTLAGFDSTEFTHAVDFGRAIQVLVFVTERDERTLLKHINMGCMGYLLRGAPPPLSAKRCSQSHRARCGTSGACKRERCSSCSSTRARPS